MSDTPLTTLLIVRHGETLWNVDGRIQGHLDSPLTPLGQRQTHATVERLTAQPLHAVYSSDTPRAAVLAREVADRTGLPVRYDTRLREWNLGIFEGMTRDEADQKYPEETQVFRTRLLDYVIPQGESRRQKHERARACILHIAQAHPGERIAIVTHGGLLDDIFRFTVGLPLEAPRRHHIANAALNTIAWDGVDLMLDNWNDTSHLGEIETIDGYLTTPNGARR